MSKYGIMELNSKSKFIVNGLRGICSLILSVDCPTTDSDRRLISDNFHNREHTLPGNLLPLDGAGVFGVVPIAQVRQCRCSVCMHVTVRQENKLHVFLQSIIE